MGIVRIVKIVRNGKGGANEDNVCHREAHGAHGAHGALPTTYPHYIAFPLAAWFLDLFVGDFPGVIRPCRTSVQSRKP